MAKELSLLQERFISAYIGNARGNATEAARQAGYKGNDVTLAAVGGENLRKPLIAEAIDVARTAIRAEGIANRQNRVDRLNADWYRMQALRDARALAGDLESPDVAPGADTGLLVRQEKPTMHGTIVEYAFDRALMAELRATEEQAAKELGQWSEKRELVGADGKAIEVHTSGERQPVDPADVVQLLGILSRAGALPGVSQPGEIQPPGTDGTTDSLPPDGTA